MSDDVIIVWKGPKCLIEAKGGDFVVNAETLQELRKVDTTLTVVSIVGLYRTGKSYLLTRLAGKEKGFPVGNTTEGKTKGIWAWCIPHPRRKHQQLLLLDTAGLADTEQDEDENKIFVMAALLSSTLIYNMKGAFDDDAIGKLSFVADLAKHIKTSEKEADKDGGQLDVYLPEFVLVLRDFCFKLEVGGKKVTANEYLENCLKAKPESKKRSKALNESRLRLQKYFKHRNCFPIAMPASGDRAIELDSLPREELDSKFLKNISTLRDHVINQTKPFQTVAGHGINGRMLATLAETYIEAICKEEIPCIDRTMHAMAEKENLYVFKMANDAYDKTMENLRLPTATEDELLETHHTAKAKAHQIYVNKSVMDSECKPKEFLDTLINAMFTKIKERNQELSTEKCQKKLEELLKPIREKLRTYFRDGGCEQYEEDIKHMLQTYGTCEHIGLMKNQVWLSYSHQIDEVKKAILERDELIKNKAKAEKLAKSAKKVEEEAKQLTALAEDKMKQEQQKLRQIEKEFELLQKKTEEERNKEQERMDVIIRRKEEEIERLKMEGREKEIQHMKQEKSFKGEQEIHIGRITKEKDKEIERLRADNLLKEQSREKEMERLKKEDKDNEKRLKEESKEREGELTLRSDNDIDRLRNEIHDIRKALETSKDNELKLLEKLGTENVNRVVAESTEKENRIKKKDDKIKELELHKHKFKHMGLGDRFKGVFTGFQDE